MIKIKDLVPTNLEKEKEKFFERNFKYNPQFTYLKEIPQKELAKHGKTKLKYAFLAKRIIRKYQKQEQLKASENYLSQEVIEKRIKEYLAQYSLEKTYSIEFSKNHLSRISVNVATKVIKIRLPILITEESLESVLDHEIGTHVIRQENYQKQKWHRRKKKNGLKSHIKTEEGLAIIHEMLNNPNKLAYKSAINYLGVRLAERKSFVEVFQFFNKYWNDPERAWIWTLKKKRGLKDTSKKGVFSKDLVYFEGFIEVMRYLRKNNFDLTYLYYGKISHEDLKKVKKLSKNFEPILPKFFSNDRQKYKEMLQKIAKENFI